MLAPKKTKYNKPFKSNIYGLSHSSINFGYYGVQATTPGRVTTNQIESVRRVITRFMKRQGQLWIRIFPHYPLTKKPNETRMGRGKGSFHIWYANVKVNEILFEFSYIDDSAARSLCHTIASKLPINLKLIKKNDTKRINT